MVPIIQMMTSKYEPNMKAAIQGGWVVQCNPTNNK